MSSLVRKIGRRLRDFDLVFPHLIERSLLRGLSSEEQHQIALPLVVIVGPPRVGSTLMSQVLVNHFSFFYFNNFQHAFLRYPYLAYRISRWILPEHSYTFESDHGFVKGLGGLSEGMFFWPFWFDMALSQREPEPDARRLQHVKRVFDYIYEATGKPMLNASNTLSFYLKELEQRFEKVVVINMRRDPVSNALSLLRARKKFRSDVNEWWSIQPKECRQFQNADVKRQIVCQIVEIYRAIALQRSTLTYTPVIDVHYETLCDRPRSILERINAVCSDSGVELAALSHSAEFPSLSARQPRLGEEKDAEQFHRLFDEFSWDELWA